jgi:hypothetical protein
VSERQRGNNFNTNDRKLDYENVKGNYQIKKVNCLCAWLIKHFAMKMYGEWR